MTPLRVVSICSGVGAMDLGLERAGMEIVAQVEIDPWCRRVLERHWPEVPRHVDLTTLDPAVLPPAAVVAGGPPCQPISDAGRRLAQADPRWLWPHVIRVVAVLRPRWVLLENPDALLGRGFGDVLGALAEIGYDASWQCIAAADVGAPHLRERVWILAYPNGEREPQPSWTLGEVWRRTGDGGEPLANTDSRGGHGLPQRFHPQDVAADARERGQGTVADPGRGGRGPHERDLRAGQPDLARRGALADADAPGRGGPLGAGKTVGSAGAAWRLEPGRPGAARAGGPAGTAQPVLGGVLDGPAAWLDGYRWPAPPGTEPYDWEPPRTVAPRTVPDRGRRVSACGNAVVVPVVELIGRAIVAFDEAERARWSA